MKIYWSFTFLIVLTFACGFTNQPTQTENVLSPDFNAYWYNNEAEITSYKLEQARYGEVHQGDAVLIFVTEPFSKEKQVKADQPTNQDYQALKLNFTKKFNTGIYPYSMMMSSFLDVNSSNNHAFKVTMSSQEWCGHTYTQMNNKNGKFDVTSFSYFESEGDQKVQLNENWLEDELWSKLRLNPNLLPTGEISLIPSFFYLRLMHKELKVYSAIVEKKKVDDEFSVYEIHYPKLDRTLKIKYKNSFPYAIEGWEELYVSGWGNGAKKLTTKATKNKSIKMDYWNKHSTIDVQLRKELGL